MPTHASARDLAADPHGENWRVVLDGVMGGRSTGELVSDRDGDIRFKGTLSLENNGGFSQIRTPVEPSLFAGSGGVAIRVRGDGRTYIFDVRTMGMRNSATSFQREFRTLEGVWMDITLPFDSFVLKSYGRPLSSRETITPSSIVSVVITLADSIEGRFDLEVRSIDSDDISDRIARQSARSSGTEPVEVSAESVTISQQAIRTGVELFNSAGTTGPALLSMRPHSTPSLRTSQRGNVTVSGRLSQRISSELMHHTHGRSEPGSTGVVWIR
ncbi:MAG: CIA30 family protein [Planctomycetota bacterium]|jgi:hypothetical protein